MILYVCVTLSNEPRSVQTRALDFNSWSRPLKLRVGVWFTSVTLTFGGFSSGLVPCVDLGSHS